MKTVEELHWILDSNKRIALDEKTRWSDFDEKIRRNVEFVHALGLKCDCVGWSTLDLHSSRADEILSAIDSFCKENGFKARGVYTRTYADYESDWYEIKPSKFKDNTLGSDEDDEYESEQGDTVKIYRLRAYHELRPSPKRYFANSVLVPERFRDACIRHGVPDVDFCWARDMGKYRAEQYFFLYSDRLIRTVGSCENITVEDRERIEALGGQLPKVADIFYQFQFSNAQTCYIASELPDSGIAYTCTARGILTVLIHKHLAQILLREKAISETDLTPAMVADGIPQGYTLETMVKADRPIASRIQESIAAYEALKKTDRPIRMISEKDALKILRAAKKARKEDFRKALPKAEAAALSETRHAPVIPYYLVTNGYFSDEYEFLSYGESVSETDSFVRSLLAEELLEDKPDGIVIGRTPGGDKLVLCKDGKVIRFSHEEPTVTEEWPTLAQFVADSINE